MLSNRMPPGSQIPKEQLLAVSYWSKLLLLAAVISSVTSVSETIRKPPLVKAQTALKIKCGEKRFLIWRMELLHSALWHDHDIDFANLYQKLPFLAILWAVSPFFKAITMKFGVKLGTWDILPHIKFRKSRPSLKGLGVQKRNGPRLSPCQVC